MVQTGMVQADMVQAGMAQADNYTPASSMPSSTCPAITGCVRAARASAGEHTIDCAKIVHYKNELPVAAGALRYSGREQRVSCARRV